MKASQFFISTLKEAPADAEVVSHRLMLRAGFIKRLVGRHLHLHADGPARDPQGRGDHPRGDEPRRRGRAADAGGAAGRAVAGDRAASQKYGPELLRVKDRHDRDFVIQPTSEEVITDIARQELRSYRALPKNFYHIQTKFRDERRPRFGVMRGREFTMKDAYSFDRDLDAARARATTRMYDAYVRIFERMGLTFRAVAADTGAIGGIRSHEFQVIADTGEDAIVYSADVRLRRQHRAGRGAGAAAPRARAGASRCAKTPTPGKSTCEDVAALLGLPLERTVKSLVLATDDADDEPAPRRRRRSGCCWCAATTR